MDPSVLKSRFAERQDVTGSFVNILAPPVIELLGERGVAFAIIDAEHTAASLETIENLVLAAKNADIVPIVRLPGHEPDFARRVLDIGADGVVVPRLRRRDDLDRILDAVKHDPVGSRGLCSLTRSSRYTFGSTPEDFRQKNERTIVIGLVETKAAVEHIDEIFRADQLDAAILGPGDLSQSMGRLGALEDSAVREKLGEVIDASHRHDLAIGAYAVSVSDAKEWLQQGATFAVYSDIRLFRHALSEQLHTT